MLTIIEAIRFLLNYRKIPQFSWNFSEKVSFLDVSIAFMDHTQEILSVIN